MGDLSGLGAIASGLQSGLEAYRGERELRQKREQQERERMIQDTMLADKGFEYDEEGKLQKSPRGLLLEQEATALKAAPYRAKGLLPKIEGGHIVDFERDPNAPRDDRKYLQDLQIQKLEGDLKKTTREMTPEGKLEKMPATEKQRFDSLVTGARAVKAIEDAMAANPGRMERTSMMGFRETPYTVAATKWEEAIGRMQSGGAITRDEAQRFRSMLPGVKDSPDIARVKMNQARQLIQDRTKTFGLDEKALAGLGVDAGRSADAEQMMTGGLLQQKQKTPFESVASPGGPKLGEVQEGYRFKGGNPADPNAWEKL